MTLEAGPNPRAHDDYTVGWVCALAKEQTAATAMLDAQHGRLSKPVTDNNTYTLGSIDNHNIVIACLPFGRVGNNSSATVATQMVSTFPSIKFGLMVGIGGGIPPKVRLGDVVVSTPIAEFPGVVQWDMGKVEQERKFKRTQSLNNPPTALLTALTTLQTRHEMQGSQIPQYLDDLEKNWSRLAAKYCRSDSLEDVLFAANSHHRSQGVQRDLIAILWEIISALIGFLLGRSTMALADPVASSGAAPDDGQRNDTSDAMMSDGNENESSSDCSFCDKRRVMKRKPRDMVVHYGLIASGNRVIKDAGFRDDLNRSLGGHVLCVEMEAAGLMNDFPCVIIRGICDYADSHKNKAWQEHAAAVAAAFAKELLSTVPPQEVQHMPTINNLSHQLEEVATTVNKIHSEQRNQEHQYILDWLSQVDYAKQQVYHIKRHQVGTGQWFLNSTQFNEWLQTKQMTLFSPGIPGAGKTTLASIVIAHLIQQFQSDDTVRVAYVYLNYKQHEEQNADALLANILKQIAQNRPSLPESVESLYKAHKSKGTRPLLDKLSSTLQSVCNIYSRVLIVVDALDEFQTSDGQRALFLSEIKKLQAVSGVNIFVTSRDLPDIRRNFEDSIELPVSAVDEDIRLYLDSCLPRMSGVVGRNKSLQEEAKKEIAHAARGMFLLAKLHTDSLDGMPSPKSVRTALKKLNGGSDAYGRAYDMVMERVLCQVPASRDFAIKVLSWLAFAIESLTTEQLQHALAVEENSVDLDRENLPATEDMISMCGGLVAIDETNTVHLVHYTTHDYFSVAGDKWFPTSEASMAKACITYLSFDTFNSGCCTTADDFENRMRLYPLYNHAARNWGYYANHSLPGKDQTIMNFLQHQEKLIASVQATNFWEWDHWILSVSPFPIPQTSAMHVAAEFRLRGYLNELLSQGHDPNEQDNYGRTALSWAAEHGNDQIVEQLLAAQGVEPDAQGEPQLPPRQWLPFGDDRQRMLYFLHAVRDVPSSAGDYPAPPLWHAARSGWASVVTQLLACESVNPNLPDPQFSASPLWCASAKGHAAVVKLLLEHPKIEPNIRLANGGTTPLFIAAWKGCTSVVDLLLTKQDVDPNSRTNRGYTPLMGAVIQGNDAVVQRLLSDRRVDTNSKDDQGWTSLWHALRDSERRTDAFKALLTADAIDPNALGGYGWKSLRMITPLQHAVNQGRADQVKLLLASKHIRVDQVCPDDAESPLMRAVCRPSGLDMARMLLTAGADANWTGKIGKTPLMSAISSGCEEGVKILLAHNADPNIQLSDGMTPLKKAVEKGQHYVVRQLLDSGADLDSPNPTSGQTALFLAVSMGNKAIVDLLLGRGAAVNRRNSRGRTPLEEAISKAKKPLERPYQAIIDLLLKHEACCAAAGAGTDTLRC